MWHCVLMVTIAPCPEEGVNSEVHSDMIVTRAPCPQEGVNSEVHRDMIRWREWPHFSVSYPLCALGPTHSTDYFDSYRKRYCLLSTHSEMEVFTQEAMALPRRLQS